MKNILYQGGDKFMERGLSITEVLIGLAGVIFILLPLFTFVSEKHILFDRTQIIEDSVDLSNISLYNAISPSRLSEGEVYVDEDRMADIFLRLLRRNLGLDENMGPGPNTFVSDKVQVESLKFYAGRTVVTCPDGNEIKGPCIHSTVIIPVKPVFFQRLILDFLNRENIELRIHVDSEIPVNN